MKGGEVEVPKIKDDLTMEQLQRVMGYVKQGDTAYEDVAETVHTLLRRPENVFYRDIGHGRGMWVTRNNTIICPRSPEPAAYYLGGCRWKEYERERDANADVLNLARGMSYKWAILNLMFSKMALEGRATIQEVRASRIGGGKSVIYEPHYTTQNFSRGDEPLSELEKEVLKEKVVPVLEGLVQYIFAPDMGTRCAHVDFVAQYAPHNVACMCLENGGSGDPSLVTARGVYESLLESVAYGLHQEGLDNLTVAVQGIGKVGSYLVDYIVQDYPGVSLIIADTDQMKVAEELKSLRDRGINALQAEPNEIYDQQFDVFSPNAMGQIVNPSTIPRMARANRGKKLIIVGAANNQIDERRRGGRKEIEDLLRKHKILYAPDFVVNLGGILNLIYEFESVMKVFGGSYKRERPLEVVHGVRTILREIYDRSAHTGVSTQSIADRLAEEHLARWAVSGGFGPEELLARSYLVDVLPTASGNTVPIS
jgi:leucine dehydrogenase